MRRYEADVIGRFARIACVATIFAFGIFPAWAMAEDATAPKKTGLTCGTCPEGYATTGVTQSPEICKEGDPTLVQCVPLGANMLAVCGACPEDYNEIGASVVPARCGNKDGGRLTQCQLQKMEQNSPDPAQGMKTCPPDCGNTGAPGQGALPPPPNYQPQSQQPSEDK
ncbi:MAG: hypothetical protein OEV17_00660 [Nitrospira sp.]|nr:hypothetical protein [Nitrospira sp.]